MKFAVKPRSVPPQRAFRGRRPPLGALGALYTAIVRTSEDGTEVHVTGLGSLERQRLRWALQKYLSGRALILRARLDPKLDAMICWAEEMPDEDIWRGPGA